MTGEIASMGQLADKALEPLRSIIGPPLEELGELLADKVRYWRFRNQVNIILKAKSFLEEKGIQPKRVPLKILAPLLEHSSWEENPDLQIKWAALLANAANPECSHDMYSTYIEILNQMSPLEAKLLDLLFDEYERTPSNKKPLFSSAKRKSAER